MGQKTLLSVSELGGTRYWIEHYAVSESFRNGSFHRNTSAVTFEVIGKGVAAEVGWCAVLSEIIT